MAILIAVWVLRLRIRQIQKDKGMENTNDASNSTNSNTTVAMNSNSNENNAGREGREGEGGSMEVNQHSRYNDFAINNATPSNNGSLTAVHPAMQQQQQGLGRVRSTRSQIVHNIHEEHRKSQIGKSSIKF